MIAAAALYLASVGPTWDFIGISRSGLRMFVDRASIREVNGLTETTVRLGSPRAIVGRIVEVTEREQIDCSHARWRMLSYEALDENGAVVKRGAPMGDLLPVEEGSIGATIRDAVCRNAGGGEAR